MKNMPHMSKQTKIIIIMEAPVGRSRQGHGEQAGWEGKACYIKGRVLGRHAAGAKGGAYTAWKGHGSRQGRQAWWGGIRLRKVANFVRRHKVGEWGREGKKQEHGNKEKTRKEARARAGSKVAGIEVRHARQVAREGWDKSTLGRSIGSTRHGEAQCTRGVTG